MAGILDLISKMFSGENTTSPTFAPRAGIDPNQSNPVNPANTVGSDETRKRMIQQYLAMISPSSGAQMQGQAQPQAAPQASYVGQKAADFQPITPPPMTAQLQRMQYLMKILQKNGQDGMTPGGYNA